MTVAIGRLQLSVTVIPAEVPQPPTLSTLSDDKAERALWRTEWRQEQERDQMRRLRTLPFLRRRF